MTLHFPTVPLEVALQKVSNDATESILPLALVVDDEPLVLETVRLIFNSNGLSVVTATNGLEALEMACLMPPDILISDVVMPGLNGFDLAVEVQNTLPECDIILITGEPSTWNRAVEYHALGYDFITLIKPVHPTQLLACAFELLSLRGWLVPDIAPGSFNPADMIFLSAGPPRAKRTTRCKGTDEESRAALAPASIRTSAM
jgi:DNA-binding response OmpR family regulator